MIGKMVKIQGILSICAIIVSLAMPAGVRAQAEPQESVQCSMDGGIRIEEHTVETADNWRISIARYRDKKRPDGSFKPAVILCHGFNFNNLFWDLDESVSLARYLAEKGYDVWSPSLRGSGKSSKSVMSNLRQGFKFNLEAIKDGIADLNKFNWTIDDHIQKDAPAIIEYVKKESGFDKVYWIGHSMGGIVMYGYLETVRQDDIAGFMPIGSMTWIDHPLPPHLQKVADQESLLQASLIINTRAAAQLRGWTFGAVKYPIEELLFKRENVDEKVAALLFKKGVDDTAPGVIAQFSKSLKAGYMLSNDGSVSYAEKLKDLEVPIMIIAGADDAFASFESLVDCHSTVASTDKTFILFSKEFGYSEDYGHSDVIIGKNSKEEIYPIILSWLDRRAWHTNLVNRTRYEWKRLCIRLYALKMRWFK
jgi:polyhydroxyalkanoate synthase